MPRRLDPACVGYGIVNGPGECRERLVVSDRAQEGPLLAAVMISTKLDGTNVWCARSAGPLSGPVLDQKEVYRHIYIDTCVVRPAAWTHGMGLSWCNLLITKFLGNGWAWGPSQTEKDR